LGFDPNHPDDETAGPQVSDAGRPDGRSDRHFQFAFENLFEQFAASAGTPELQFCVIGCGKSQHDEVCTHIRLQILNSTPAAAIETISNTQDRRELSHPIAVCRFECAETHLG